MCGSVCWPMLLPHPCPIRCYTPARHCNNPLSTHLAMVPLLRPCRATCPCGAVKSFAAIHLQVATACVFACSLWFPVPPPRREHRTQRRQRRRALKRGTCVECRWAALAANMALQLGDVARSACEGAPVTRVAQKPPFRVSAGNSERGQI